MKLTPILLTAALVTGSALAQTASQGAAQAADSARDLAARARNTYPAGSASIDQNLWKQAAAAAEAAVQAEPGNADYLKLRAQIYTEVGFWKKAEEAWNAYFKVAPGQAGTEADRAAAFAQYNLGYAAYTRGNPSQAAGLFANCLKIDPQNVLCNSWAARTALEAGEYARAQGYYEAALKLTPDNKTLRYFNDLAKKAGTYGPAATTAFSKAYDLLQKGDRNAALARFQEAAQAAPNFIEAWRESGRLALEAGNADAALTAYQGATKLPTASAADKYNLGLAQEGQQYGLNTVKTFRAAYARYAAGDKTAALGGFQQAAQQNPRYAKAWAWVGRVQYEARNYPAAAEAYAKAVELDPNDKSSAHFLKMAQAGR
ncbi:tetratricopeptide repeat protein [Deinococcus fonticola]|uniref:tetratricopeptide repeat protein n=1 Tax=Deinococcus fonticola TaxID=2528713 RepID=UPI0010750DCC|nr:tetratricopeptide repeat protein [Deinococcus fonticola]